MGNDSQKKIKWLTLAFMAFTSVWGFGNIINGFFYYRGLGAVIPWILIFVVYFVPYVLMVGELGSAFKNEGGGVSSWINRTIGAKLAFYAGWTYWVVHMPYLSQKPTNALVGVSWIAMRSGDMVSNMNPAVLQLVALAVFFVSVLLALRGVSFLKKISSIAGTAMFIMSILFILMMFAAPAISDEVSFSHISPKSFVPIIDKNLFTNVAILILAVGGCEKLSPYVNKMDDPSKGFPKGMIALAVMVAVCAILGTIALSMIYVNGPTRDMLTNGAYVAFQRVGRYYGLGDTLMIIYALCWIVTQIAVIILSIDAPLRMLLDSADEHYIPNWLRHKNKYGAYSHGILIVTIIVSILIIIPIFGGGSVDGVIRMILDLNAICMPLRYLWVFFAYVMIKRKADQFPAEYRFVKNNKLGQFLGWWCFALTAYACLSHIISVDSVFQLILNIATPFILVGLGLILPTIAKKTNFKQEEK